MTGASSPARRWTRWSPTAVVLAAIVFATLRPSPPPATPLPMFCLVCGELGGVDVALNIILFIPLGAALAWSGMRWHRAVLVSVAVSLGIESLQFTIVPGRDASLGDLLTNSIGGCLGAGLMRNWKAWLLPPTRAAGALALGAAAAMIAVLLASAALLQPAIPYMDTFGQWAPRQPRFAPFTGSVHDVTVNGMHVPYALVPERDRFLAPFQAGTPHISTEVTTGQPTERLSAIARGANSLFELFLIGQDGTALIFRTRLEASDWALRQPSIALDDALPTAGVRAILEGGLTSDGWYARVRDDRGTRERRVPFAVSLGWSFLMPFDRPLGRDYRWLSALWLIGLAFPAAYWSALAALRRPTGSSNGTGTGIASRGPWLWMVVSPLAIFVGLTLVPRVVHFQAAHWSEWLATLGGALAGWTAGELAARQRRNSAGSA
jgi:hypothetical protein